jgi:tetratricopeptide (TPR) repeat protein
MDRLLGILGDTMVILSTFDGEHAYDILQIWERTGALEEAPGACAGAVSRGEQIGLPPELMVDLMIRITRLLRSLGSWPEAEVWGCRGIDLARDIGDREKEAEALEGLGDLLLLRGDYDGARNSFEQRRQIYVDAGNDLAVAHADGEIGMIEMEQGNYDEALKRFNRMYDVSRQKGDRPDMARAVGRIGQIHAGRGEHQEALRKYVEALELFTLLGDRSRMAFFEGEIGLIAWNRMEYEAAMDHYQREEKIYRTLGDRHGAAMAGCKIGLIHVDRNELDRAETCFTDYLRTTTELGYRRGIGFAQGDLGIVRLRRGDLDEAMQLFDQALHTHRDLGFPLGIALWLKWKGEVVLAQTIAGSSLSPEQIAMAHAWVVESGKIAASIGKTDAVNEASELASKLAAVGSTKE